jgi:hypothetical protein
MNDYVMRIFFFVFSVESFFSFSPYLYHSTRFLFLYVISFIRMYCYVIVMQSFLTLLSDFMNFVFEDGALWVRNRHVHIAKRRWI